LSSPTLLLCGTRARVGLIREEQDYYTATPTTATSQLYRSYTAAWRWLDRRRAKVTPRRRGRATKRPAAVKTLREDRRQAQPLPARRNPSTPARRVERSGDLAGSLRVGSHPWYEAFQHGCSGRKSGASRRRPLDGRVGNGKAFLRHVDRAVRQSILLGGVLVLASIAKRRQRSSPMEQQRSPRSSPSGRARGRKHSWSPMRSARAVRQVARSRRPAGRSAARSEKSLRTRATLERGGGTSAALRRASASERRRAGRREARTGSRCGSAAEITWSARCWNHLEPDTRGRAVLDDDLDRFRIVGDPSAELARRPSMRRANACDAHAQTASPVLYAASVWTSAIRLTLSSTRRLLTMR